MPSDFFPDERLLLAFDGLNIVRRVYGAVPGDDSTAKAEGAIKSSLGTFKRLLKHFNPSHVAAAFDHGGETWRHRIYPGYHAGRKPMPEPLREQLPNLFGQLEALGVPVLRIPDVEADDVIATLLTRWAATGKGQAVAASTDKDLCQLMALGQHVRVYDPFKDDFVTDVDLVAKFCVGSSLLGDCLSLMSDAVDGVPGIKGVGPKTAGKWLDEYRSLGNLLANADKITGVAGQKLRDNINVVKMSRELIALKADVTLNVTWARLEYRRAPVTA